MVIFTITIYDYILMHELYWGITAYVCNQVHALKSKVCRGFYMCLYELYIE